MNRETEVVSVCPRGELDLSGSQSEVVPSGFASFAHGARQLPTGAVGGDGHENLKKCSWKRWKGGKRLIPQF